MHYVSKTHSTPKLQFASENSLSIVRKVLNRKTFFTRFTFQIQIFGTINNLSDHFGVHFQAVGVTVVSSDDDVVPLVVIQGTVTVTFDHIGAIPEVKHIVYVPVRNNNPPVS